MFIVYMDTCYLGDPELDERLGGVPARFISKVAKGALKRGQAERIQSWCSLGSEGKLPYPDNPDAYIPKDVFQCSLKIIVAHHYLFEPSGSKREPLLQMRDARAVFGNLAGGDFDLYLCGHKHYPDVQQGSYDKYYDRRGKSRHLLNLYRRLIGLGPLPMQVDEHGRPTGRAVRFMLLLTAIREVIQFKESFELDGMDEHQFEQFMSGLQRRLDGALENPQQATRELTAFMKQGRIDVAQVFHATELAEIEARLSAMLSKEDRAKLKPAALRIQGLMRELASRSFVQILAGSACKEADVLDGSDPAKQRGFNCYRISADQKGFEVVVEPFTWHAPTQEFRSGVQQTLVFRDAQRAIL